MKIPHERNMYDKVGAFGVAGPQVSGFGFLHDGSEYSMNDFLNVGVFNFTPQEELDIDDFQMSIDTGYRPVVGQQVEADDSNYTETAITDRVGSFIAQAEAGNADLIVKGRVAGAPRGALYVGGGMFQQDKAGEPDLTATQVLAHRRLEHQPAFPGSQRLVRLRMTACFTP